MEPFLLQLLIWGTTYCFGLSYEHLETDTILKANLISHWESLLGVRGKEGNRCLTVKAVSFIYHLPGDLSEVKVAGFGLSYQIRDLCRGSSSSNLGSALGAWRLLHFFAIQGAVFITPMMTSVALRRSHFTSYWLPPGLAVVGPCLLPLPGSYTHLLEKEAAWGNAFHSLVTPISFSAFTPCYPAISWSDQTRCYSSRVRMR